MNRIKYALCFFVLFFAISACTTGATKVKSPGDKGYMTQSAADRFIKKGGDIHSVSWHRLGPILLYSSSSMISGNPILEKDPKTIVGKAEYQDVKLTVFADGIDIKGPAGMAAQALTGRFTKALAEQRILTWRNVSNRKYNFHLYYIYPKYGVSRKKIKLLLGKTFHLSFYKSARNGMALTGAVGTLSHESYHLEVSALGSHIPPKDDIIIPKALRQVLNETSATLFSQCVVLRSEDVMHLRNTAVFNIKLLDSEPVRHGTLTDAQMRIILDPKQTFDLNEAYKYGPAMLLTLWTEYAGLAEEIQMGEPAADKFFDLSANNIANPADLWPMLWALANDGKDAPEIQPRENKPQTRAESSS